MNSENKIFFSDYNLQVCFLLDSRVVVAIALEITTFSSIKAHQLWFISTTLCHTNSTVHDSISFPVQYVICFESTLIFGFVNLFLKSVCLYCCLRSEAALFISFNNMIFISVFFKWIMLF